MKAIGTQHHMAVGCRLRSGFHHHRAVRPGRGKRRQGRPGGTGQETPEPGRRSHQRADPEQLGLRHRPGERDEIHGQHPAGHSGFHQPGLESHHPHHHAGHLRRVAGQGRHRPFRPGRHHAEFLPVAQGAGGRLGSGRRAGRSVAHGDRQRAGLRRMGRRADRGGAAAGTRLYLRRCWPTISGPTPAGGIRTSTPPSFNPLFPTPPRSTPRSG